MSLDVSLYLDDKEVFTANITHNLGEMAEAAGIYQHVWRPKEMGITRAKELIEPIGKGLELMRTLPATFKQYDSPNGWGLYKHFVPWLEKYLAACEEYPMARVEVCR